MAQGGIHFRRAGKIERAPAERSSAGTQNPVYITTVWGYGYKWGF